MKGKIYKYHGYVTVIAEDGSEYTPSNDCPRLISWWQEEKEYAKKFPNGPFSPPHHAWKQGEKVDFEIVDGKALISNS